MNQKEIKKRYKLISSPGVLGIFYDILDLYYDYYGLPKPCKESLGMNVTLLASIVKEKYKKQIAPIVKKSKVKQLDLEEESIKIKEKKK